MTLNYGCVLCFHLGRRVSLILERWTASLKTLQKLTGTEHSVLCYVHVHVHVCVLSVHCACTRTRVCQVYITHVHVHAKGCFVVMCYCDDVGGCLCLSPCRRVSLEEGGGGEIKPDSPTKLEAIPKGMYVMSS